VRGSDDDVLRRACSSSCARFSPPPAPCGWGRGSGPVGAIVRRQVLIILSVSFLVLSGCLTTGVNRRASDPHPEFDLFQKVRSAGVRDGQLYLKIEAAFFKPRPASDNTVVLRMPLDDLDLGAPAPTQKNPEGHVARAAFHVADGNAMPEGA